MYKKIKNYKSLLDEMKKKGSWHFNPSFKSNDAKYLGNINLSKIMIKSAISSVEKTKLKSAVEIFKSDLKNYEKSEIAWSKMDNIQSGYNEHNTKFKQVVYKKKETMPNWAKKLIIKSKLKKAYLAVNMNPPGTINPWHYDTYAGLMQQNKNSNYNIDEAMRILIFVDSWKWGHFLQVGNQVITNWRSGDVYTWSYQKYHLASNSGIESRYTIAITGYSKNKITY